MGELQVMLCAEFQMLTLILLACNLHMLPLASNHNQFAHKLYASGTSLYHANVYMYIYI